MPSPTAAGAPAGAAAGGTGEAGVRCAPWTRAQGVDPIGSAGRHDAFVLVEAPLPWPHDVGALASMAPGFAAAAHAAGPPPRLLAVAPEPDRPGELVGVTSWWRVGAHRFEGADHLVARTALAEVVAALAGDPAGGSPDTVVATAPPEVLICTHGRRDACCGRWGTLLATEVAARWAGVRVRRCSHTGGHRFAPTGYTLPDGRGWADLDADVLDAVVGRGGPLGALHAHQRGTTALSPEGQVLERAVFESSGWAWLDAHDLVETVEPAGAEPPGAVDGRAVTLRWRRPDGTAGTARGTVRVARTVPVPVCGEPLERAVKSSDELVLDDVVVDLTDGRHEGLDR